MADCKKEIDDGKIILDTYCYKSDFIGTKSYEGDLELKEIEVESNSILLNVSAFMVVASAIALMN